MNVNESAVEKQFDYFCKLVIKNSLLNYKKQQMHRNLREKSFSEITPKDFNSMQVMDDYELESFSIGEIRIENEILYEALLALSEMKREVIVLRYFADMTDTEIGMVLNVPRTTAQSIRYSAIRTLKIYMEDSKRVYEKRRQYQCKA